MNVCNVHGKRRRVCMGCANAGVCTWETSPRMQHVCKRGGMHMGNVAAYATRVHTRGYAHRKRLRVCNTCANVGVYTWETSPCMQHLCKRGGMHMGNVAAYATRVHTRGYAHRKRRRVCNTCANVG